MGGSIEYHLAKADYQCRRALAKLSRAENQGDLSLVHRLGHAIATLREAPGDVCRKIARHVLQRNRLTLCPTCRTWNFMNWPHVHGDHPNPGSEA